MIEVENLTKQFGNHKGVYDLNFTIEPGTVFGFLGPNGAGKSTTIRMLMGFMKPTYGRVIINGMDSFKDREKIQKSVGYISGEISLLNDMTGKKYLDFMLKARGINNTARKDELVRRLQLDEKVKIGKMSKGMKQKVAIIQSLMHEPSILMLDEPTSGLDPLVQQIFLELINEEKAKGTTILMSSHSFTEVSRTCDTICIIKDGRIVDLDNIEQIQANARQHYIIQFKSAEQAKAFISFYPESTMDGVNVKLNIKGQTNDVIQHLSKFEIEHLNIENETLEEIFLHFYDRGEHHDAV
ncbi:ABC transporter ATP-binding protein [Macrococcoides caseolyticum]|uniref:ABC transporter ATP-binding protein n=1 Tax=Macrococcoides caseolyticum TaxID=69966 RepID=UPI001F413B9F|nr:ABC transporter ATP-binding protein [Macrococcus caseolyticus]MCE4956292.1 ABC transporter ATP-binding protein [Macrococcus caseolyticus]